MPFSAASYLKEKRAEYWELLEKARRVEVVVAALERGDEPVVGMKIVIEGWK